MQKGKRNNSIQSERKARNLIRGAISSVKRGVSPYDRRHSWRTEQISAQQINKAISIAKNNLNQANYLKFEIWMTGQLASSGIGASGFGKSLTLLGLFPSNIAANSLVEEIELATTNLVNRNETISDFSEIALSVSNSIKLEEFEEALGKIEQVCTTEGFSYWALETELALVQLTRGTESLKNRVNKLLISSYGLNKFLIYNFGVRNEPAQNTSRFKVNLKKRIDDSNLSIELKSYSKFRLYGQLDADPNYLSRILACEKFTTTIDLLFTLLRILRYILANPSSFYQNVSNAARTALIELDDIYKSIGVTNFTLNTVSRNIEVLDSDITFERLSSLSRIVIDRIFEKNSQTRFSNVSLLPRGLASHFSTKKNGEDIEELSKYLMNFNWIDHCVEIGDLDQIPQLASILVDYWAFKNKEQTNFTSFLEIFKQQIFLWLETVNCDGQEIRHLVTAVRREIDAEEVLDYACKKQEVGDSIVVEIELLQILLAHIFLDEALMEECLKVTATCGVFNEDNIEMLPLAQLFSHKRWRYFQSFSHTPYLSICLDLFLKVSDDRKVRTFKRYAVEELINTNRVPVSDLPSLFFSVGFPLEMAEYFGLSVCDISTIELLPNMENSRIVKETRCLLLRNIVDMHTNNELVCHREIEEIEETLVVTEGLDLLDDSKVYVDEKAILNSVNKEMASDFQRYLKLLENGDGEEFSMTEILNSFKNPSSKIFRIPKNEAGDLLAELLNTIMEKFLLDPVSGLDAIIGRRIRHGTIASEIRGYLESAELIGQKARFGASYDPPGFAVSKSEKLELRHRKNLFAAFSRFSESIDHLISILRDEYFHVASKSKPRGIFELTVNPIVLALARSISKKCPTMEVFSKEVFQIFWFVLSVKAESIRPTIEKEIKKELNVIFDRIGAQVRAIDKLDPIFIAELQRASESLQQRASVISAWIRVPSFSVEGRSYSMQHAFDVAVAVVTGQHANFTPMITQSIECSLELDTHGFSIVEDALYLALKNVYEHSGKKAENQVCVQITFDSGSSLISFTIENELADGARTPEKESKVEALLNDIKKRTYRERARLDRGSGLSKLASIVMQCENAQIWFGFTSSGLFKLQFDLEYVALQ